MRDITYSYFKKLFSKTFIGELVDATKEQKKKKKKKAAAFVPPIKIPRDKWPEWMKKIPQVVGVSIGCIYGAKWSARFGTAHAHPGSIKRGWICFRDEAAWNRDLVRKHEVSHLLAKQPSDNGGHTKEWAQEFIKLGLPKKYTLQYFAKKYGFDL